MYHNYVILQYTRVSQKVSALVF